MEGQSYTTRIEVPKTGREVFKRISDVSKWWVREVVGASTEFEGESSKLNDEFILRHGDNHYSKHKLTEVIPGKKIVWLVTDSRLNWIKRNKQEWTGTKMIFEIIEGEKTTLVFTHKGLVPQLECYIHCVHFWGRVIKEWLFDFMNKPDYHVQLKVNTTREQAMDAISNVPGWWAQEVDGNAKRQGDQFTVHFGKTWGKFRVVELNHDRIIWEVTDCYLDLLKDTKEWSGTRLIFRFSGEGNQTVIDITHEGLTPDKECFNDCTNGWNFYFKESLVGCLERKQGLSGAGIHAWLESGGRIYKGKIYTREQLSAEMSGDLLLLDVKETCVEQVLSAYSVRLFNGDAGKLKGDYYMLLNDEPGLLEHLQNFVSQNTN